MNFENELNLFCSDVLSPTLEICGSIHYHQLITNSKWYCKKCSKSWSSSSDSSTNSSLQTLHLLPCGCLWWLLILMLLKSPVRHHKSTCMLYPTSEDKPSNDRLQTLNILKVYSGKQTGMFLIKMCDANLHWWITLPGCAFLSALVELEIEDSVKHLIDKHDLVHIG